MPQCVFVSSCCRTATSANFGSPPPTPSTSNGPTTSCFCDPPDHPTPTSCRSGKWQETYICHCPLRRSPVRKQSRAGKCWHNHLCSPASHPGSGPDARDRTVRLSCSTSCPARGRGGGGGVADGRLSAAGQGGILPQREFCALRFDDGLDGISSSGFSPPTVVGRKGKKTDTLYERWWNYF